MPIATVTISIFAITTFVKLFNRFSPIKVCPICAGVSGTWLMLITGMYAGILEPEQWKTLTAVLVGGSVVGIAYQVEKFLPRPAGWRTPLLWKTLFIPSGFIAANLLLSFRWLEFLIMAGALLLLMSLFLQPPKKPVESSGNEVDLDENKEKRVEMLETEMEECC